jgi:hypothetical protein
MKIKVEIEQKTVLGKLYELTTGEGAFLMVAPMLVIANVYKIHQEGVARAMREIPSLGYCEWFSGNRSTWQGSVIVKAAKVEPQSIVQHGLTSDCPSPLPNGSCPGHMDGTR